MNVIVTAYNPNWPALYEQEAQAIRQILGKELIAIHHIGSTSVPGLLQNRLLTSCQWLLILKQSTPLALSLKHSAMR